jgi:TRAP transporter TAXI family solute receptor
MVIPSLSRKQVLMSTAALLLLLGIFVWLLTRYISPAPPGKIDMTTGAVDGASHQFALKYQSYLKANGVTLNLLPSSGSVQNLERLNDKVPAGFVQGGLGVLSIDPQKSDEDTPLRSLGVVGYEPIWLFTSSAELANTLRSGLNGLKGKKIAIGAEGSGTRKVALELLNNYGVSQSNANLGALGGAAAAKALIAKEIDAAIIIGAPQSAAVQTLLEQAQIKLVTLDHAEGLTRRLPYLSLVTLKAGSVDPLRDLPKDDIALLTTTANLVVRDDLHPALAYLLLEAARDVHKGATLLNKPGDFPHPRGTDFPLAEEAQRYYKDGRPFLQRYLPYWAANALQRLLLILLPLLAIAIPVLKTIPGLLAFKDKSRLYRRYEKLLKIERNLRSRQLDAAEIADATIQLDEIEQAITFTKFPLDFTDRIYTLRQHVDYVRGQLQKEKELLASPTC